MKRFLLALCLVLPLSGCKLITAAPTPGVTQFYSQAALVINDFSGILLQAQQLFATAHGTGLVSDADYAAGTQAFKSIATNGDSIYSLLKAGGDQATITAQIKALIAQVGTMPTAFHINNPAAQAQFTALTAAMQSVLDATASLI